MSKTAPTLKMKQRDEHDLGAPPEVLGFLLVCGCSDGVEMSQGNPTNRDWRTAFGPVEDGDRGTRQAAGPSSGDDCSKSPAWGLTRAGRTAPTPIPTWSVQRPYPGQPGARRLPSWGAGPI